MHRGLLQILALLPRREVTRAVKKRDDKHTRLSNLVLKSVSVYEHFANSRVVQFRDNTSTFGERRQVGSSA